MSTNKKGFTLVEVLVVMPIVILVIGGLIGAIVVMTGNVLATRSDNALMYNIQDALDRIESDVKISGGFLATNNLSKGDGTNGVVAPQGSDNSDTGTPFSSSTALVLNSYATTKNPIDPTSNFVFIGDAIACGAKTAKLLTLNTVYFVDSNKVLWRRTLVPYDFSDANIKCDSATVWQQPSCSFDVVFSDYPSTCKVKDIKLVTGVESFTLAYYKSDGTAISDAANVETAGDNAYVQATINASGTAAGRKFTESGTIRAVSLNNNHDAN